MARGPRVKIVTDGRRWPLGLWRRVRLGLAHRLRQSLRPDVEIRANGKSYRFRCEGARDLRRCMSALVKEAGTYAWITSEVKPGDVFYDIGANIGLYTIMAAREVGSAGRVYAFEPHSANFARLVDNIDANGLAQSVNPCSFALNDRSGLIPFNYVSLTIGSSNSQLGSLRDGEEQEFRPELSEPKAAMALDDLIERHDFLPPHHVKLDVDGNELLVLRGMARTLQRTDKPRSIQIEMNLRGKTEIVDFLAGHGYVLADRHYTRSGLKKVTAGGDPEAYAYNAIFRPRTS
jgi:FkbM family methyltransferase